MSPPPSTPNTASMSPHHRTGIFQYPRTDEPHRGAASIWLQAGRAARGYAPSNNVNRDGGSAARSVFGPIGAKPAAVNDVGVSRHPQAR